MKRKWLTVLMAGWVMAFIVSPAWAIPMTNLIALDDDIVVGETFEIEVWANDDVPGFDKELIAFGFDVDPDSTLSLLTYTGYTIGTQFFDDGDFFPQDVNGSAFPGVGDDDVLLATLSFTAGSVAGTESLTIRGLFDGISQGLFYFDSLSFENMDLDIDAALELTVSEGAAPVPEPSTIVLLSLGLVGTAMMRKRSKSRRSSY